MWARFETFNLPKQFRYTGLDNLCVSPERFKKGLPPPSNRVKKKNRTASCAGVLAFLGGGVLAWLSISLSL